MKIKKTNYRLTINGFVFPLLIVSVYQFEFSGTKGICLVLNESTITVSTEIAKFLVLLPYFINLGSKCTIEKCQINFYKILNFYKLFIKLHIRGKKNRMFTVHISAFANILLSTFCGFYKERDRFTVNKIKNG